ncbi:MAG: glycine C-acetyltransferase [Gemmatales bacterium]|nr:glycine C-acetyltransferase [Gemmatales bacterium]MDW7994200.1 glycine C-acetyltransferase [Gemmatales bacterium]
MSAARIVEYLQEQLEQLRQSGLYKTERVLASPQGAEIETAGRKVLNFCANNYLGLATHPSLVKAASEALAQHGFGMASVRFICGTHQLHKELESAIAHFFQKEDAILYTSCFDANGGFFEAFLTEQDTILSDELNHASIIDGIRLCKAKRRRYRHSDMADLEAGLKEAASSRFRVIVTDGVFSMDGDLARLPDICELADKYDALVMVDDSHATGVLGAHGRGSGEALGVHERIDVFTSTLGKALGGAVGGFTVGRREIIEWLRQRSRPYLFSNALPPAMCAATLAALQIVASEEGARLRQRLQQHALWLREALTRAGFTLKPGQHPILPVMIGDAALSVRMADELLQEGIYVIGFSYPVVPQGQARIRIQVSALHEPEHLERAVAAFRTVGQRLGVIS